MNQEPKKDDSEDLKDLKDVMKKLEELQKKRANKPKKPRKGLIAIEFGGVFHRNRYINFAFNYLINFIFVFFVIEIFKFADYSDIMDIVTLVLIYTILEDIFRTYLLMKHFSIVLKTFGTVFYFGYLLLFFMLDQYIFVNSFNFVNAIYLAFFVLFFTISRYFFGQGIRNNFRRRNLR